jgi:nitroreductase
MNEVLRAISSRRSIRQFGDGQLKRDDVNAIIEAGLSAPSANNVQNWHFTVVQNKTVLAKVNKWILDEIENTGNHDLQELVKRGGGSIFRNAPTVVIVSTDAIDQFGIINGAAATENMLLAAESLGIGSCWIGMVGMLAGSKNFDSHAKDLQLPTGYAPQFGITLGYKESESPSAPFRKPNLVSYIL